jgi:hypothetical protein
VFGFGERADTRRRGFNRQVAKGVRTIGKPAAMVAFENSSGSCSIAAFLHFAICTDAL